MTTLIVPRELPKSARGFILLLPHFRYVQSWIDKREVQSEKANLTILFEKYVPVILEANRVGRFKKITPIQEVLTYIPDTMIMRLSCDYHVMGFRLLSLSYLGAGVCMYVHTYVVRRIL